MRIQFPAWLYIVCEIIFAVFVLSILYKVWKYGVYQHVFSRKKSVKATLVSKVQERYREIKVYNTTLTSNRPAPGFGATSKNNIAYRLYFDVAGKNIKLDVDKKNFDEVQEGSTGMLTYKGCVFYSFDGGVNCNKKL